MARPLLFAASTIFLFPLAIHGHTVCQTALERTFFGLALNDSHFMLMLNPTAGRSQHYLTIVLPKYRFICSITSCVLELHSSNLADITDEVSPNFPVAENKGTFLFAFNHTSGLARLYSNGSHFNWYPTGSNKSVRLDIDTAGSNFDLKEAARMSLFSSKSAGKFAYLTSGSNAIFEAKYTTEPSNKKKFHFAFTFTSDVLGKIIPKGNIQGGFYWNDQLVALDNAARKLYFYKLGSVKAVEAFRVLNYADFVQCSFDPTSDGSSTTVAGIKTWHAILVGVILLALGIAVGLCIIKRREHRGTIFSSEGSDPKGFRIAPTSGISLSTSSNVKTASVKIGQFKRGHSVGKLK